MNPVIEQVIQDKVQNNELFTAHDITLEVRNRGHRAKHDEVKDIVHDFYNRGLMGVAYGKSNISVPNGNPILYYPLNSDPNIYSNIRNQSSIASNPSTITIPSFNSPVNLVVKKNKPGQCIKRFVDRRQALSIPCDVVKKAGFIAGQKVYVTNLNDKDKVIISDKLFSKRAFTVDNKNQIRITQNTLNYYGLGGQFYDIKNGQNSILVELSK